MTRSIRISHLLARRGRLPSGTRSREATAACADGVVGAASTQIYSEVEPPPRLLTFWMLRDILFMVASAPSGQDGRLEPLELNSYPGSLPESVKAL
jgi:hypothetical protein